MTRLDGSPVARHGMTDSTMPHLGVALDPQQMCTHFQQLLFGAQSNPCSGTIDHVFSSLGTTSLDMTAEAATHTVVNCKVMRVKYRAGEKCVVSYCLTIHDRATGEEIEVWFSARLFPAGLAESRYQKALRSRLIPPRFGRAVMFLPVLDMVIWAFPNDRKIAGIPALLAAASGADRTLTALVAGWATQGATVRTHKYNLVHYVPEQTCTVRVQLGLSITESAPPTATIFGKAYYNDDGAETYRLMQQLWQSPIGQPRVLQIARPLAYDEQNRILWQSGLPGKTLLTYQLGTAQFDRFFAMAARSVALLHRAALLCKRITTQQAVVALIAPRARLCTTLCPQLMQAVERLTSTLYADVPAVAHQPTATLHGDLHLQNFLVAPTICADAHVALIDLDNLSTGSPWQDLGSLIAGLYYRSLVDGVPEARIKATIDQFLAVYATYVPWSLDHAAINWYTAAALLNERVYRTISRMKEGRLSLVDELVRIANTLLSVE